jgi:DNA (cytosine-5)-methyltransferase 1
MTERKVLTVGSLFTGIGGFDLGLERAGMRSVWQCEIDGVCQRVLEEHWPDVLRVQDVRDVRAGAVPYVNVLAGGFPCKGFARVGRREGFAHAESGLWRDFRRIIGELRPHYVLVENVRTLLSHGRLGIVLGDLAALGYDAEWDCFPASCAGAPHPRDRIWLLAYPRSRRYGPPEATVFAGWASPEPDGWWADEPDVARVADGVPFGVDRRRALGNALVPQIAEWIGQRILAYEAARPL